MYGCTLEIMLSVAINSPSFQAMKINNLSGCLAKFESWSVDGRDFGVELHMRDDVLLHVNLRGNLVIHPILVSPFFRTHKACDSHVWFHMLHTHPIPNRLHPCQFLHTSAVT
ncbi:hypothetical protein QVD17_21589 [Tagetes erecta]|uniref:Uncharacterized protein n=1 Tax=Tagetes erecta TaxID=13708 RepID=A0AAD8NTL2_TARER|nr:hypothetical protein QVD17_21589 [Tagetes erecta]